MNKKNLKQVPWSDGIYQDTQTSELHFNASMDTISLTSEVYDAFSQVVTNEIDNQIIQILRKGIPKQKKWIPKQKRGKTYVEKNFVQNVVYQ